MIQSDKKPRILIISHNCMSVTGSNGRTLYNFFYGYPQEKLAQFFIVNEYPDLNVVPNSFRLTDKEVLQSLLTLSDKGRENPVDLSETNIASAQVRSIRNDFTVLCREILWSFPLRRKNKFKTWLDSFEPELVLLQAGDLGYLCKLATQICRKRHIPLVVYNSEGYYFKQIDFIQQTFSLSLLFRIYHRIYCRAFERMMKIATHAIYISEDLRKAYETFFATDSTSIYTSSSIESLSISLNSSCKRAAYLGNLGLGRCEMLIELAKAIHNVCPDISVDIYGPVEDANMKHSLEACPDLNYMGFVSYQEVQAVIKDVDLNIHVESFLPFFVEDSKYAFSTKIADLLTAGKCILLYAPPNTTVAKYLRKYNAACVITEKSELESALQTLLHDPLKRREYAENALRLARKNHDMLANRECFQRLLCEVGYAGTTD